MMEITKIVPAIEALQKADDHDLQMIFKHINDVITLSRIISFAAQQLAGAHHE